MKAATALWADLPSFHFGCMRWPGVSGRMMPVAKARWMARRSLPGPEGLRGDLLMEQILAKFPGLQRFAVHFVERGNAVVPFQQRRGRAGQLDRVLIHFPDRVEHGVIVGIED